MLWRHIKIKFILVPPCIGLLGAKYHSLPCRKSHNIFSSVLVRGLVCPRFTQPSMLTYCFKFSYISSWMKNMLALKILGGTCRLRLIFTPCCSFLRMFFSSIFVFPSINCILNSLESISIWYQMKAYCIKFQLNTRYIHFVAIKICQMWKTYPSPFLKWQKRNLFP